MIEVPRLSLVPAGRFDMGTAGNDRFTNSTERPVHDVVIERSFFVSTFPTTEAQWSSFRAGTPSSPLPVVRVSWFDATAYSAWLRERTGRPFRLLTETEWEYACRAGSRTIFSTGDDITPQHANYLYDEHGFKVGPGHRTPEGRYGTNAFGLEDMHGNVCEWVSDRWRPDYTTPPVDGLHVIRGGAWDYMPRLLRSAWRDSAPPGTQRDNLGFRVACDL